jgi:hypothetical protein
MRGRGRASCKQDAWLLSRDAFDGLSCPFGHSKPRIRSTLHLAAARDPLENCASLCWLPNRVADSARAIFRPAHGAQSTGSRVRSHVAVPTLAQRVLMFPLSFRLEEPRFHARVHFTSFDVIEHTHCARSIFSVLSSRKLGVLVSETAVLLELLRRPTE